MRGIITERIAYCVLRIEENAAAKASDSEESITCCVLKKKP
jgi:hypothetical protein